MAPEIPLELTELRACELADSLLREELDAGFSFGAPDDAAVAQRPTRSYPAMALLPLGHELASKSVLPIAELLAFPLLSCSSKRQPGLLRQMQAIVERHTTTPTIAGEACTLTGNIARIAAGMGVGIGDAGYVATLCRDEVVAVPVKENERITTFVLHKQQRFLAHSMTLSRRLRLSRARGSVLREWPWTLLASPAMLTLADELSTERPLSHFVLGGRG